MTHDVEYILGIETSCDDTSLAVAQKQGENIKILAQTSFNQESLMAYWGGVVPEIAARNHLEKIIPLLDATLKKSNITMDQMKAIAVTTHPGLLGPLLTGMNLAKTLALIHKLPIIPINHLFAHIEAIFLTQKIAYPYLALLVSGGHSLYFYVEAYDKFHILGSTIDDAAGEAFDKGAKLLGLGYPGGKLIDDYAKKGDPKKYDFPIGLKKSGDARLSYSGVKTSFRAMLEKNPELKSEDNIYDLCASYQDAITEALVLKMQEAISIAQVQFHAPSNIMLVVGGGVACNSNLRQKFQAQFKHVAFVAPEFCTDNASMIAHLGAKSVHHAIAFPAALALDAKSRFIDKKEFNL